MPQTDFLAAEHDNERLVRSVLAFGMKIVPDIAYESSDVCHISDWGSFLQVTEICRHFFLVDDSFDSPFGMTFVSNKGHYRIMQMHGGPCLSLLLFNPYYEDGQLWLPSGHMSYYETYKNTITANFERISSGLRRKYGLLVEEIKRGSRVVGTNRSFWIMPEAYEALKAGAKCNVKGLVLPSSLE